MSAGPLRAVLETFTDGETTVTLDEIARRKNLDPDTVRAAVDHLLRTGRLTSEEISAGCPEGACGGCPLGRGGAAGCPGPSVRNGPALVALSIRR